MVEKEEKKIDIKEKVIPKAIKNRRIVIETDGRTVNITEMGISPLEACEICKRIIKQFGGN